MVNFFSGFSCYNKKSPNSVFFLTSCSACQPGIYKTGSEATFLVHQNVILPDKRFEPFSIIKPVLFQSLILQNCRLRFRNPGQPMGHCSDF